jgi:hypothetical protein
MRTAFSPHERRQVGAALGRAADLVSRFYVLAPREWAQMPYEVRTLAELAPAEVHDGIFAEVRCYGVRRQVESHVVAEHDLYRICLQDHEILATGLPVPDVLLYVLTHELVHVVRFGQRMQALDLAPDLRRDEEAGVDRTARRILGAWGGRGVGAALERIPAPQGA